MRKNLDVLFTSLQGRYAKALFAEGRRNDCLDEISEDFATLEDFLNANHSLSRLLTGGFWNKNDLDSVLVLLGERLSFCTVFLNFVRLVVYNERPNLLSKIRRIYDTAYLKYKNVCNVIVYSVIKLKVTQKRKIEKLICKLFNEDITVSYEIDKSLLAGIRISADGIVVDASAITQIRQLESFCKDCKVGGAI